MKSCRTCKYYQCVYGLGGNKPYPSLYVECIFKKDVEKNCKANNFNKWEKEALK